MGDTNQFILARRHAAELMGPYLEVGSRDYGSTQDLHSLFAPRGEYVGVDMQPGRGVDVVCDLTADFEEVNAKLAGRRFGTIFCLSVLEHCARPFRLADNLTDLLRDGGHLCLSVPFAWEYHAFPGDYWRFTHEGVQRLFPRLEFDLDRAVAAGRENEFTRLDENLAKVPFSTKAHWKSGHRLRTVSAGLLKLLGRIGVLRWLSGYRYVLRPTMIFMIGERKRGAGTS